MITMLTSVNNIDEEYAFETVSKYIKPDMTVLCVPFASDLQWQLNGDYTQYIEQHYRPFIKFGIKEENFDVVQLEHSKFFMLDLEEKIDKADIILLSGGFMENLMYLADVTNLDWLLHKYEDSDKIIIGESAGTLALQEDYWEVPNIEEHYKHYAYKQGLGVVEYLNLIVHFDKDNEKHLDNYEYVKSFSEGDVVIGLSDQSMIIVDGDEYIMLGDYMSDI